MGKSSRGAGTGGRDHQFGGNWTEEKLHTIAEYLRGYTTALKKQPFRKLYIDAFAGTGYRTTATSPSEDADSDSLLFPDLVEPEPQRLLDGSARIALQTDPHFDGYVFIERNPQYCAALEKLKEEFPRLAPAIDIRQGDANTEIQNLCAENWSNRRAVLFLDPYGMQVEWKTIEAIAKTQGIDLWILFPLGIGVNRLLTKDGQIPPGWRNRLNLLLGTEDWYEEFYSHEEPAKTLFGTDVDRVVKASIATIGRYFIDRLKTIFAAVAEEPKVLRNSRQSPLYLLCFAVGNERGAVPAMRIANHILKKVDA